HRPEIRHHRPDLKIRRRPSISQNRLRERVAFNEAKDKGKGIKLRTPFERFRFIPKPFHFSP
ncbi:MAG: hypothetical protein ABI791_08330, partial [Acidobacteriota bacterium]